ncbi:hypothetical protein GCM10010981_06280 [Dyella nitratireducens]|uniref:Uncharacterized protein n=1 Tax=Dyella nitratireducens TaxID=1849580 RepID=A0ABQ1FL61_9GAMM|nr:hypothetical protein GCM10010981_06280 [Dyella nitratireducens]GLQ44310.1 hypothetical protein GCM10007902_41600 [Dyella nitratireducens]
MSDPDSSIASTHRFSRPLSWFAKQPRFGTGLFYRENDEHEIYGDENKRTHKPGSVERRTRDASRFSIKALSELDTRKLSANAQSQGHANRENLAFLQRERDPDDGTSFSPALIRTNMHGYQSRGVALEPLYKGRLLKRNIDGKVVEQQPLKKERDSPVEWQGGTFPDWVAQRRDDGKLIAFDLKVPRMAPVAYLEKTIQGTVSTTYYDDIKHEIAKRRQQMPEGTEQRLVFDLISGGHDYKTSRSALAEFAAERGDFPADSVQFLYRKKSGVVKMSKPILREHLSSFSNKRKVVSDFKKTNK